MTTNMRNPAEQAAYALGRATAHYEFATGNTAIPTSLPMGDTAPVVFGKTFKVASGGAGGDAAPKKRRGRVAKAAGGTFVAKAANAPKEPKAPVIARGIKRASTGPRTPGVKKAIMDMIGQHSGVAVADIISQLGFKETSVRTTLMGLKKSNIAAQDGEKNWYLTANALPASNSEHQSDEGATWTGI